MVGKYGTFISLIFLEHMKKINLDKSITNVVMFDGVSNVQLGGGIMKNHNPKVNVMSEFKHTIFSFFSDVSKLPIVNQ